jgi:RNA polymerase sigma-70 factor (ECF subfamily)
VEDRELIQSAQSGNKEAFAVLVQQYHRNIYNLAYRMTGNREDAMDVTQEVLFRAYRAVASFQPEKPFLPWVYRITWNICADRGRKIGRTPPGDSLEETEDGTARLPSPTPGPDSAYENKELREVLSQAIDRLAEGYKELIVMFHVDGLSIKEISDVTGMKETVIKNRLYRGRQMLRKILEAGGTSWTA